MKYWYIFTGDDGSGFTTIAGSNAVLDGEPNSIYRSETGYRWDKITYKEVEPSMKRIMTMNTKMLK